MDRGQGVSVVHPAGKNEDEGQVARLSFLCETHAARVTGHCLEQIDLYRNNKE